MRRNLVDNLHYKSLLYYDNYLNALDYFWNFYFFYSYDAVYQEVHYLGVEKNYSEVRQLYLYPSSQLVSLCYEN